MNNKLSFILKPTIDINVVREILKKEQQDYSEIIDSYEKYNNLKTEFSAKWNSLLNEPHYKFTEEVDGIKIKTFNSSIAIATAPNIEYAEVLVDLLNMSYREGAKEMIEIVMQKFS
jgi:hypothetical protein